jgi:hypothetical protein
MNDATETSMQVRIDQLEAVLARERAKNERLAKTLTGIYALLYPPQIVEGGMVASFRPDGVDLHDWIQKLSDRIRAIPDEIGDGESEEGESELAGRQPWERRPGIGLSPTTVEALRRAMPEHSADAIEAALRSSAPINTTGIFEGAMRAMDVIGKSRSPKTDEE